MEYFTILLKENDTTNLKLLTEKLNEGYHVDTRIEVGRSVVVTLRNYNLRRREIDTTIAPTTASGLLSSMTYAEPGDIPFTNIGTVR